MLYLAEVQKQKSGFGLGGGRSELKLLACQRSENNWVAVPGDDVIPADDASNFKEGALVLVDLNSGKQVQRIQEAARQLVSILQEFSRLQEKFKTQQEEIEQWKESLTYQSQELNRREMEMEAQREQVEQLEEEFERLEQQRQEIANAKEESDRLQQEVEQARQEIEATRGQLESQTQALAAEQAAVQSAPSLSDEQAQSLRGLLDQMSPMNLDALQTQVQQASEKLEAGQSLLQVHWQQLQEKQSSLTQLQRDSQAAYRELQNQRQAFQATQVNLVQARSDLDLKRNQLQIKQTQQQKLQALIQEQQTLIQQLERLAQVQSSTGSSAVVDVGALENMPLETLQAEVETLRQEWEKGKRLVADEEEELKSKQEEIVTLQNRIQSTGRDERVALESELSDEQDAYQMLNRTVEGQLQTLRDREAVLNRYQTILWQRQGQSPTLDADGPITFDLLLSSLKSQQPQHQQDLQTLTTEISKLQTAIAENEQTVSQKMTEQDQQRQTLEAQEQVWAEATNRAAEISGQVQLYQEMLQPVQDRWDELRSQVETATTEMQPLLQAREQQTQQMSTLSQTLNSLVQA
ncbi:MAG: pilus motility taxis protein HmpF [Microcoleaceae cyanobacterium]